MMSQSRPLASQSDGAHANGSLAQAQCQHASSKMTSLDNKSNSTKNNGLDPESIKSPSPCTSCQYRPASHTSSFKTSLGSKSGFLSLLLCCTSGAASLLGSGDKSSAAGSQSRRWMFRRRVGDTATSDTRHRYSTDINIVFDPPTLGPAMAVTKPMELAEITSHPPDPLDDDTDVLDQPLPSPQHLEDETPTGWLLPPLTKDQAGRKCLVLDLDETLVHSSFKEIPQPDFIVEVEIENQIHNVYVQKRPGVDEFMRKMGEKYEVVVFTASLSKYADPVLDELDIHRVIRHRLFRESCYYHEGSYVKDLSQLGRDLVGTLILDNSPASYAFHIANAVPVSTWFNDPHDTELSDLISFLDELAHVDDVTAVLNCVLPA